MKNVLMLAVIIASLVACKNEQPKSAVVTPAPAATTAPAPVKEIAAATHHCPMHPEVVGKEGDECGKCGGMKLVLKK